MILLSAMCIVQVFKQQITKLQMLGVKARALPTLGHTPLQGLLLVSRGQPDESLGFGGMHLCPADPGHNDSHTPPMALLCCGFQTEFLHRLITALQCP